jgi:putative membrane protein insertion efficiency factor
MRTVSRIVVFALRGLVLTWRYAIAALLPGGASSGGCRYHPTCSQYALDALRTHGPVRGTWLATKRVARCHPWSPGGHDPVAPRHEPGARHDSMVPR